MATGLKKWSSFVPAMKETLVRFPLPTIAALCASLAGFLLVHDVHPIDEDNMRRFLLTMAYSVIGLTSVRLLVESCRASLATRVAASTATLVAIVAFVWNGSSDGFSVAHVFFALALGLSLLFAPYIDPSDDSPSVWYFNYQSGVGVFFAVIAALVLGVGMTLSLVSVDYLFGVGIPRAVYSDVWILCWGVLFPIYVLASLSKTFIFPGDSCSFPKGVSFITNYILVPLMFAYMAILYAYFLKIVVQWELPRGNLSWMVIVFGTIGITTKLLVYPIRDQGTRLLVLFDRYYYYALIVPIALLSVAIVVRVRDYGITEDRYAVMLLGIWFGVVTLGAVVKQEHFPIKLVPMILGVMLLLGSFGPWGAASVSLNSQLNRFEALLNKYNLIVNGRGVKATGLLSFEDRKSLSSIADYLTQNDSRIRSIWPWFESLAQDAGKKEIAANRWGGGKDVLELLGVGYVGGWAQEAQDEFTPFNFKAEPGFNSVAGFDYSGHGFLYACNSSAAGSESTSRYKQSNMWASVVVHCNARTITIKIQSGETIQFNVADLVGGLTEGNGASFQTVDQDKMSLSGVSESGRVNARLTLEEVSGQMKHGKETEIANVSYMLLMKISNE